MELTKSDAAVAIGDVVTYADEYATPHTAIVTNVFLGLTPPSVNVVYVSGNENETDQYGRQIKRASSVVHQSHQAAHGRFWSDCL